MLRFARTVANEPRWKWAVPTLTRSLWLFCSILISSRSRSHSPFSSSSRWHAPWASCRAPSSSASSCCSFRSDRASRLRELCRVRAGQSSTAGPEKGEVRTGVFVRLRSQSRTVSEGSRLYLVCGVCVCVWARGEWVRPRAVLESPAAQHSRLLYRQYIDCTCRRLLLCALLCLCTLCSLLIRSEKTPLQRTASLFHANV